jgi:hypothetical protein
MFCPCVIQSEAKKPGAAALLRDCSPSFLNPVPLPLGKGLGVSLLASSATLACHLFKMRQLRIGTGAAHAPLSGEARSQFPPLAMLASSECPAVTPELPSLTPTRPPCYAYTAWPKLTMPQTRRMRSGTRELPRKQNLTERNYPWWYKLHRTTTSGINRQ